MTPENDNAQDPTWSCYRKRRYGSEEDASYIAAQCYKQRGIWLRVYACDQCLGWHLTRKDARGPAGWRPPRVANSNTDRRTRRGTRPAGKHRR